jgi:hypothetical protein
MPRFDRDTIVSDRILPDPPDMDSIAICGQLFWFKWDGTDYSHRVTEDEATLLKSFGFDTMLDAQAYFGIFKMFLSMFEDGKVIDECIPPKMRMSAYRRSIEPCWIGGLN